MFASRLVRLIETHSDALAHGLVQRIHSDPKLAEFQKVPREEILVRAYEIYRDLSTWLLSRTEADVEALYRSIGERRASQGLNFSAVARALLATKEHLWQYVKHEVSPERALDLYQEIELFERVDQFFDRALYYTARGFESARKVAPAEPASRRLVAR